MFRSKSFSLVKGRCRYVNLRWVKFLIIPGLAAFTLLLILSNVKHPDYYRREDLSHKPLSVKLAPFTGLQCTKNMFCVISCIDGDIANLKASLANIISDGNCEKVDLHLLNIHFPEEKMMKGWIDGDLKINSLQIRKSNLREIAPGSFKSSMFAETVFVELAYLNLEKITKGSLDGLHSLKKLILLGLSEDHFLEDNFFEGLLLEELSIQVMGDKKDIKPKSLLGSIKTPSIKIVDLTGNRLGKLAGNDTFETLTGIETLTLADCRIIEIEPGTFDSLPNTLKIMDLRRNSIKSIVPEVFKGIIPAPGRQVLLCNNPLSCSIDMCPFTDFYINNEGSFEPNLKCFDVGQEMKLEDNVLCKNKSKQDVAYSPVTEVSIEPLEDRKKIHCDENVQNDFLEVAPPDAEFYVESVSSTGVKITLIKTDGAYSILWFHSASTKAEAMETNYNDFGLGCNTRVLENVIIEGMKSNSTYVFCLLKVGASRISPFNCHSHYLEVQDNGGQDIEEHLYIWGSKPLTIFLVCIAIVVSFVVGGCSAYYIISWKPTLVKGSKRVLVVNKSSPNVLVLPRNSNSSFATSESNKRKVILRRHSDCSVFSGKSYVEPINMYEAIQYHQRKWRSAEGIYADKIPKDCPPPLPKRLSNNSTISVEDIYGSPNPTNDCQTNEGVKEIDLK